MKRIIVALFVIALAAACREPEPYINFLSESLTGEGLVTASLVSAEKVKLEFPPAGGSLSVPFMATAAWSARVDCDWCTVDPSSGEPSAETSVTVTAMPNITEQQRTCTVTVSCGEVKRYIAVSQQPSPAPDPDKFYISPSAVDLGPDGGTFSVTVTSTLPYHISSVPDWITESGVTGNVHSFKAGKNESPDDRSGVIVFCSDEGVCLPCNITQAGNGPYIALSPIVVEFSGEAGSEKVSVTSNEDWTLSSDSEWCKIDPVMGSGNATVTVSVEENEEVTTRNCMIAVSTASGIQKELKVVQYGADIFVISPSEVTVGPDASSFTVKVLTPRKYHVNIEADWITESAAQDGLHTFLANANPVTSPRSGVIVFCDDDGVCIPCMVTQEGAVSYITVSTGLIEVDEEESQQSLSIKSNDSWTISSDVSWCTASPSEGSGDATVKVIIQANPESATRRATLTARTAGGCETPVMIKQSRGFQSIDWAAQFYHRSLVMDFTATWCVFCPWMHAAIELAQELYPDKLIKVALHDDSSSLPFSEVNMLEYQFGVYGFPTAIVDGRIDIPNDSPASGPASKMIDAAKETESFYGTVTGMEVSSALTGRNLSIDLTVYAKKAGDYKLTVLLLEDGIYYEQVGVDGGKMMHNDLARIAVTSVTGDTFTVSKDKTGKSFFFAVKDISASYDVSNMKILAFVHAPFGDRKRITSANYGDFYVDNCVVVPFGKTLTLQTIGSVSSGQGEGISTGDDIDM